MSQTDREPSEEHLSDDLYGVAETEVAALRQAIAAGDAEACAALIAHRHVADLADLVERLPTEIRQALVHLIGDRFAPELFTHLREDVRHELFAALEPQAVAAVITELDTDDAVDVVENLEEPIQAEVLEHLEDTDRRLVEEALAWPEESAGRLMDRAFVAMPSFWTVGDAIDHLRDEADRGAETLPDAFFDIYVVDPAYHPLGSVSLSRLLRSRRPTPLLDLIGAELHSIPVSIDQEEVAGMFRRYDLASAPVVDDAGRLVGVITHDDVMDVIHEEAEEDIMRLAGVLEDDLYLAAVRTSRSRISWLLLSMMSALVASLVIWQFETTIQDLVALAILMPVVAAIGGNAGTQAMTVAVRSIAMKELSGANSGRVIGKEVLVGVLNGLVLASLAGLIAGLWFQSPGLGAVVSGALMVNLIVAGFVGVLIPLTLNRFGVDPAVASAVFLITVTDVVGFAVFLGFAALFLV